jgi:membrane protease YdiL (CAAX protease family)
MTDDSTPASLSPDSSRSTDSVRLTGWFERNHYSPTLVALLTLVVTFILFQGIGTVAGALLLMMRGGMPADVPPEELLTHLLETYPDVVVVGNSIGQVLGLALPVWFLVGLHTPDRRRYLRIDTPDPWLFAAGLIGWVALLPVVQWLVHINEFLPLPDAVRVFDRQQMELIEKVLESNLGISTHLVSLALVPGICEELLFRGYLQRNFERTAGVVGGIVITGLIFGVYHLRLTQVLPLCALGLYLGFVLWSTKSLWTAVAVHFANNALAVGLGAYLKTNPELPVETMDEVRVPWYSVVFGLTATFYIMYWMFRRREEVIGAAGVSE